MAEFDIHEQLSQLDTSEQSVTFWEQDSELGKKIAEHKKWLSSTSHERPSPEKPYKVAVYIRYYNQTRHENYLQYHVKQFMDTIAMCPKWELIGFYIDEGMSAPHMENSPEWSRLLMDCMEKKVDLIITQKISNISRKIYDVIFCSRMLATQRHPIGIYFISEDLFTLASYYQNDLRDTQFFPEAEVPETQRLEQETIERGKS